MELVKKKKNAGRLLAFPELRSEKGIRLSRQTIWRMMKVSPPGFPLCVHISPGRVVWHEDEVDEYLAGLRRGPGRKVAE